MDLRLLVSHLMALRSCGRTHRLVRYKKSFDEYLIDICYNISVAKTKSVFVIGGNGQVTNVRTYGGMQMGYYLCAGITLLSDF